jgi:GxxExxY protein
MPAAVDITEAVIGAAIEVHRALGPGLLESAYEACLEAELVARGLTVDRQVAMPLVYRDVILDGSYRADLIVNGAVVVEIKAVRAFEAVHTAQVLTYLRLSGCPVGLLLNFNVVVMKDGIRRLSAFPKKTSNIES